MSAKVFISYSHKDESYREELEDHLSVLRRNGIVSVWHDRRIAAGDEWRGAIDENINEADIILFLVSSAFLGSDYCQDVEVKRSIERNNANEAKIVSIVIRDCEWTDCEFAKYQAVPKDARAIDLWDNRDSGWRDAIKGIKDCISQMNRRVTALLEVSDDKNAIRVAGSTYAWIEDTEIVLSHRKIDKVNLSDIYVSPDMEVDVDVKKNEVEMVCSDKIFTDPGLYLISGEEQQGKTSVLKNAYKEFLKTFHMPVYVDASLIKKADLDVIIKRLIDEQYDNLDYSKYMESDKKVLLIDNFESIELNKKFRNILIDKINSVFDVVIITCHSSFNYISQDIPQLDAYKSAKLLGLGNYRREEIVKKWVSLGVEEVIEEAELYSGCDEVKAKLDSVIKRNIVPPKPIYILMLMQMFEAYTGLNLDLTSYGHCYQQLIYQAFEKASIAKVDFEKYLNVLTELAWEIFNVGHALNANQMDLFFRRYNGTYLRVDEKSVLDRLIRHSILAETGSGIGFKYPYIYYFFSAKKIAEGYTSSNDISKCVDMLIKDLHREDYANILVFITHHTKEAWVLDEIKCVLSELFSEHKKATLEKDQLKFMDDFIKIIPELVLEQREIQKERDDRNKKLDEIERVRSDNVGEGESMDILAKINKTFKGMEIAGQIIRNRHAAMKLDDIYDLANSGASSGLRFLDYFIEISDASKNEVVKVIAAQLSEHPSLSDQEVKAYAEGAYLHLSYGVISAVIRKISASIGSKEAAEIYEKIEINEATPAYSLIKQAIELQFTRSLRIESIDKTLERIKNNPVCQRILKEMVLQHVYMFPVEYKTKQQLSEKLGISVKGQRLMDQRKAGKG